MPLDLVFDTLEARFYELALAGLILPAADPLPQALILTAIVIGFAITAFALALSYRVYRTVGNAPSLSFDNGGKRRRRGLLRHPLKLLDYFENGAEDVASCQSTGWRPLQTILHGMAPAGSQDRGHDPMIEALQLHGMC